MVETQNAQNGWDVLGEQQICCGSKPRVQSRILTVPIPLSCRIPRPRDADPQTTQAEDVLIESAHGNPKCAATMTLEQKFHVRTADTCVHGQRIRNAINMKSLRSHPYSG